MRKYFYLLACILLFQLRISAQTESRTLVILVLDKVTKQPIEGVSIKIEQLGFREQITGQDGRALFNNIPLGADGATRVELTLQKNGYERLERYSFNITKTPNSNNTFIELTPSNRGATTDRVNSEIKISNLKVIGNREEQTIEISFDVTNIEQYERTPRLGCDPILINQQKYYFTYGEFGANANRRARLPYNVPQKGIFRFSNLSRESPITEVYLFSMTVGTSRFTYSNLPISWK